MDEFLFIFIIIIAYIILLFTLKKLDIGKKEICENCNNCCPDCKAALNRIRRIKKDKITHYITFKIFDSKRYLCNECGWEGLRWEDKFKS
jgi:uncharacterized protein with PIN domain